MCKNGGQVFALPGGDMNAFLLAIYQNLALNYPKFYKMDNLSKLGWLASEVLLQNNFDKSLYRPEEVGLVLTNQNSSLDADIRYWQSVSEVPSPSLFVYTLPNIVVGEICIRNGFKGEDAFYITEGFDADLIVQQVQYLLDNDILQACICGWVDVFGQDNKAVLFLVEKEGEGTNFEAGELKRIFEC